MALTIEITDVNAKDAGEKFKGKMHNVSMKMTLKDINTIVFEQTFSEKHKDIYNMVDTTNKIRIEMAKAKKRFEAELALELKAEAEVPAMLIELSKEVA